MPTEPSKHVPLESGSAAGRTADRTLESLQVAWPPALHETIQACVQFLTSNIFLAKNPAGKIVPRSYFMGTTPDDMAKFADCAGTYAVQLDVYYPPFAILGTGLPPKHGTAKDRLEAQSQIERTNLKYGINIYDGAIWQIAIALAAINGFLRKDKAQALIENQTHFITTADSRATGENFRSASTQIITDPKKAFSHSMLSTIGFFKFFPTAPSKMKKYLRKIGFLVLSIFNEQKNMGFLTLP